LPVGLTSAIIAAVVVATDPGFAGSRAVTDVAYGVSLFGVLAAVLAWLSEDERRAAMPLERPSRTELRWTALSFPLAVGAYLAGAALGEALGFELGGLAYDVGDPMALSAVLFGGVLAAPLVEEALHRGFLLGSLLGRGYSPPVAGLVSVAVFAAMHLVSLGAAGVLGIVAWAVFPTFLRLKFDNLAGAWLLHAVNNLWSYVGVVALGWA
jgi:membrane protease YdiL (CAAX protease family)